jgi:septum site-determining protein MinD
MTKFISVVSGKGGVGKTTATLNVGKALVNLGKKVVLVDANLFTPNLAIQLGFVNPEGTLNKFLRKERKIKDITYLHESGISVIPSSPSYTEYQKTNPQKLGYIFDQLDNTSDFVLVDSPSGLGYEVNEVLRHSDEVLVVVNPNLSSVMDALKTIKLAKQHNNTVAGIILNMSNNGRHELKPEDIEQALGYHIISNIKFDNKMRKSVHKKMPLSHLYPRSRSAKEFRKVAEHLSSK